MIPKSIRPEHIRTAAAFMRLNGIPRSRQSKDFDLIVDGQPYPPKYTVALAAKEATGRFLPSDEFGGGTETNEFLKKLGFSTIAKGGNAPRPTIVAEIPPSVAVVKASCGSGRIIRVARAWMNMGVSMSQFRQAPREERWAVHTRLVIQQFMEAPRRYVERVNHILGGAESALADAVLLPACALAHSASSPVTAYKLPQRGVLVAGALQVVGRKAQREYAIAGRDGAILAEFDSKRVNRFDGGKFVALAAISSTIKCLSKHPEEEPTNLGLIPTDRDLPMVLLDAGHQPYSDHYRRHSMRIAAETMAKRFGRSAAVVLSSWQYATTKPSIPVMVHAGPNFQFQADHERFRHTRCG